MSTLADQLTAALRSCIIENFADLYLLDRMLTGIERRHGLDDPEVIAAIATCADIAVAQQRLVTRTPAALAHGLAAALASRRKLRDSAALMVHALLDGARRELAAGEPAVPAAGKPRKALPAFARPAWLPALVHAAGGATASVVEVEALVRALAAAKPGEPPEAAEAFTADSLAQLGRALVLGWLSHGADPKQVWAAHAAGMFPDDATARDLGMMARELAPRVGQFSKAQVLVDVLAAMNTRAALHALHELVTKVKTRSVRDRAKAAFDAAAARVGTTEHDLADKLIPDDAPFAREFVHRLEQRMITASAIPALELIENILQRDAVRRRASGIVFGARTRGGLDTFTIVDDRLVDIAGDDYELPAGAQVTVVHPFDLSARDVGRWTARITGAPFPQLDRPVRRFASLRAMAKHVASLLPGRYTSRGAVFGLEALGWRRGPIGPGGTFSTIVRELDELAVEVTFAPAIYTGRGGGAATPRIVDVTVKGKGSPRAMAELVRELELLVAPPERPRARRRS